MRRAYLDCQGEPWSLQNSKPQRPTTASPIISLRTKPAFHSRFGSDANTLHFSLPGRENLILSTKTTGRINQITFNNLTQAKCGNSVEASLSTKP